MLVGKSSSATLRFHQRKEKKVGSSCGISRALTDSNVAHFPEGRAICFDNTLEIC